MIEQAFTDASQVKEMIATAIESGHAANAEDFDLDAIQEATYEFNPETQRFESIATEEEFWAAVMDNTNNENG